MSTVGGGEFVMNIAIMRNYRFVLSAAVSRVFRTIEGLEREFCGR